MLTEEQQQHLIKRCQEATQKLLEVSADLNKAAQTINQLSELLEQATRDNIRLVQFIKGKGIKPPKIYSA